MTSTSNGKTHANYVAGEWRDGGDAAENRNPSNLDDVVGVYASASSDDVADAVAAARAAAPAWSRSNPQVRADALERVASEILARRDELGTLLAREEGKTRVEAVGEVARAGNIFRFFAGEALRLGGEIVPSVRDGVSVEITPEPLGVVGLIAPWNFPIAIPAWKIAPALAYGNCVVFKPAELVPGSAWALAEIIARAGLPPGVFNLVMGAGETTGAALVDAGLDALSFTGSVAVGRAIAVRLAPRFVKLQLEMGGKNPLVVLDDADIAVAVNCAVQGAYYSTGQRCTASSRLIVTAGIHDRFVAALRDATAALRVGDALDPQTQIGPVVDEQQLEQDLRYLDVARTDGATLALGGERPTLTTRGHYLRPILWTETTPAMRINREEIFGPAASVIRVADDDEALAVANDTQFGLCAGVCTTSLRRAARFKRDLDAGMVMVNLPTAGVDYHVPFGGRKGSSYGPREQGRYAREFYTTIKTTYVAP